MFSETKSCTPIFFFSVLLRLISAYSHHKLPHSCSMSDLSDLSDVSDVSELSDMSDFGKSAEEVSEATEQSPTQSLLACI